MFDVGCWSSEWILSRADGQCSRQRESGRGSGLRLGWGRWIGLSLVAPNRPQSFRDQERCQSRRVMRKITQPSSDSTRGVMTVLTLLVGPDETGNGTCKVVQRHAAVSCVWTSSQSCGRQRSTQEASRREPCSACRVPRGRMRYAFSTPCSCQREICTAIFNQTRSQID
jgi:hypothetical protein